MPPKQKNASEAQRTAEEELYHVASTGNVGAVEQFLQKNKNIHQCNPYRDGDSRTALHLAVVVGNNDIVELLLRHECVDIDTPATEQEITPLYHAVTCRNIEVAQLLLDHGANVDARTIPRHSLACCRNV